MPILLNTSSRQRLFTGSIAVVCLIYVLLAGRLFVASVFADKPELPSLQRAARMDSRDADYQNHVGRYYALVARDPSAAIASYRAAVQLNPHSARYWFDLASAYQVLGDVSNQDWALGHAIEADPKTPDVAWEAANFYLVQGDDARALREFRVVLENEPALANMAIQFCWRINPDVDVLLRDVVPANSNAYLAFLNLLEGKEQTEGTHKVWAALMATPDKFELRYAYQYLQYLFDHKDVDQARLVWQQAAPRFGLSSYLPTRNNLIVNGDFNQDVLNGGFDWQYEKQRSVTLTLDPSDFHSGHRSLLIAFDGPGVTDAGIRQFIAVQPGSTYQFSAFYKNGDFEGAGGPHLLIQDAYTRDVLYDSDELKEAGFWKSVGGEFTTGEDSRLLVLHVRRVPEGSPIRGKLWVDDFRLVAKRN
ncbi:MAG TPA: carbohydrate binding domain-containing protein [Candidatus Binatia bacterium]|nr:carbohydrate binding domain-containing protein [Candidatus Binatia bacterium]